MRALLAEIYTWFTEGFDTSDLKDAKRLCSSSSANNLRFCLRAQLEHPLQRAARALAHIFGKFYLEAQVA